MDKTNKTFDDYEFLWSQFIENERRKMFGL